MNNDLIFQNIYNEAHTAGLEAGKNAIPTPMVVGYEAGFMSGKLDTSRPVDYISEGVCGFSSIQIKPATHRFSKWLKSNGIASKDSYHGGIYIWVSGFGQSYERKKAYANAFVKVLQNHFGEEFKSLWVNSRLD